MNGVDPETVFIKPISEINIDDDNYEYVELPSIEIANNIAKWAVLIWSFIDVIGEGNSIEEML